MSNFTTEELDLEAMTHLGKTYAECSGAERSAVELGVSSNRTIAEMEQRGASTLGELMEKRRAER